MSRNSDKLLIVCRYCGIDTEFFELVKQVPNEYCTQEFLTNHQYAVDGKLLGPEDFICTDHEELFRLKFKCYSRGQGFQERFSYNSAKNKDEKGGKTCSYCGKACKLRHRQVGLCNINFQSFLLTTATQRTTRSGTGISQDDDLCVACYMVLRRKFENQRKGMDYSPVKSPIEQSTRAKRPRFTSPPATPSRSTAEAGVPSSSIGSLTTFGSPIASGSPSTPAHGEVIFKSPSTAEVSLYYVHIFFVISITYITLVTGQTKKY